MTKYHKNIKTKQSSEDQFRFQNGGYMELQRAETSKTMQIRPSINDPLDDVAVTFLLSHCIQGSNFEYLPVLYTACDINSVLSSALKAVGFASLSLYASRFELRHQALTFYSQAITKVNKALTSHDSAQHDDVLASIMLLSLYEALTLCKTRDTKAWSSHVHGAWSLVILRGPQQLQSKVGLELFKQIATGVKLLCIQNCVRLPLQLRQWVEYGLRNSQTPDAASAQPSATGAFTDLRVDIAEGLLSDSDDIISRCETVLQLVEDFLVIHLPSERHEKVAIEPTGIASPRKFYINFRNHHITNAWNTAWMAKLALNNMIYQQELRALKVTDLSPKGVASPVSRVVRAAMAQEEVSKAAENICATVPQSFQVDVPQKLSDKSSTNVFKASSLVWPLFQVGANPLVTVSTKDYIVNTLRYIASEFKLPQAQWAGDLIEEGADDEDWVHMYHAFYAF